MKPISQAILAKRHVRPRAPDDYDNETEGAPTTDPDPQVAEIVEWLDQLMGWDVHAIWVKGSRNQERHCGGYYHSGRVVQIVKDALKYSGKVTGVHFSINPVRSELLSQANHTLRPGVGVPRDADVIRRRFLPIDIDPKRASDTSASVEEKARAMEKMKAVRLFLSQRNWPDPIVVDSGNGFYLLYRIDLLVDDGGLVRRVLQALSRRFADEHVEIDTSVANAGRVLKIPGTMACKGLKTTKRPHRRSRVLSMPGSGLAVASRQLLEAVAGDEPKPQPATIGTTERCTVSPAVVEAARRYLAKLPAAISGRRGHEATLLVATKVVVGYDIAATSTVAVNLMKEFNERCQPKWNERELRRKLSEADRLASERGDVRGGLLPIANARSTLPYEPLKGRDFPVVIPDYEFVAKDEVLVPRDVIDKATPLYGIGVLMSWLLQRRYPRCPDVLLRDICWGATPPKAWRRSLRKICEGWRWREKCPKHCVLNGSGVKHQHLYRKPSENCILTDLVKAAHETGGGWKRPATSSTVEDTDEDEVKLKQGLAECWRHKWDSAKQSGKVYLAYYPILVFGRSKRIGLSMSQVRMMMGITRELTRVGMRAAVDKASPGKLRFSRAESSRRDKAEVIRDARVAPSGSASHKVVCPFLDNNGDYVVFGGNLRNHRGCGYRLFHDVDNCWLEKAGYRQSDFVHSRWPYLRTLFADLRRLAEMFDLVVVGRHLKTGVWKSLDGMTDCLKSGAGQDWLSECKVRIFAPADYLIRWRYSLSKQLGFRWIPGGEERPFVECVPKSAPSIQCGDSLRAWMRDRGWTASRLADELGYRRETVSRHLSGRRNSPVFWQAVNALASRRDESPT